MMTAKTRVTPLATVTGMFELDKPNNSQRSVPNVNNEYMDKEIPVVSFVRMDLTACGKNDIVVQQAAPNPRNVVKVITRYLLN